MLKRVIPEIMLGQSKFSLDILSRLSELARPCIFESELSSVSKPLVLEIMAWSSSFFMVIMQATLCIWNLSPNITVSTVISKEENSISLRTNFFRISSF